MSLIKMSSYAVVIKSFQGGSCPLDSLVSRVEKLERMVNKHLGPYLAWEEQLNAFETELASKYGKRKIEALQTRMIESSVLRKFQEIVKACSDDESDDSIGYFDDAKCSSKDICAPEPSAGEGSASGVSEPVPPTPSPDSSGV